MRWRKEKQWKDSDDQGTNVVFLLCFQFVRDVQIGDNELGRESWVGGKRSGFRSNRGVAEGGGGQKEQLVVGRAVSWQGLS